MKVAVDPCPNCYNPRCPNCTTRRINTRPHTPLHYQRGSSTPESVEAETDPESDLDLRLLGGKSLGGIDAEQGGEQEEVTGKYVNEVLYML